MAEMCDQICKISYNIADKIAKNPKYVLSDDKFIAHILTHKFEYCVIKFLRYLTTLKINLVIASGKLLVSILSKSMFRTHKYLKKYFVSIRYLNRFQKLKNPTDF